MLGWSMRRIHINTLSYHSACDNDDWSEEIHTFIYVQIKGVHIVSDLSEKFDVTMNTCFYCLIRVYNGDKLRTYM